MNNIYRLATIKLTFWYLALAMLISVVFSGVVYHVANDELERGLRSQTARIYQTYPVFTNDPFFVRDNDAALGSRHILNNLIIANIAVLVGAGAASYWLAKRTLQPIAEANERQKRFVADASHELRTPVTALKMSTEVALMDESASKATLRTALASNLEEADKLESLLASLLKLSKLDSDELANSFTELALSELITEAIDHTKQLAKQKNTSIKNNSSASVAVPGDKSSLVQLFVILLDNAIKYSPANAIVEVCSSTDGTEAVITVADHGIGIERESLEHVFDRFYRADKARTSNNGYGLGLAIAKHIADMHHGSITLTSTPGKGTTATVKLPLATTN